MSDKIEVDYQALEGIARQFSTEAEAIGQILSETSSKVAALHGSGWIGRGSEAFFAEMERKFLETSLPIRFRRELPGSAG